jgi:hypothetical protein
MATGEHKDHKGEVRMTLIRAGKPIDIEAISMEQPSLVTADPTGIRDMTRTQYSPANRCIYCGAEDDLTREHTVPYGLNGRTVIPAASCRECTKKTGAFERKVLRGAMRSIRVLHGFQSRSKHEGAARRQSVPILRDGVQHEVQIPLEEAPIMLYFPEFAPPGIVTGKSGTGIDLTGVASVCFGPDPEEFARKLGAEGITLESPPYEPVPFAKMLAKIGFATAYAEGALKRVREPFPVVPAIMGETNDIGRWVGTMTGPYRRYPGLLHQIALHEDRDRGLLVAEVQLFASSGAPSYGVVIGTLQPSS